MLKSQSIIKKKGRKMRVVLDTNVIVSAFLSPAGKPAIILSLALRGDLIICFNTAILAEYEEVLSRCKFAGRVHRPAFVRFFELVYKFGVNENPIPRKIHLPDETDRKFYDVAKATDAILITGNTRHYPNEPFIKDPSGFLLLLSQLENN